MHDKLAKLIENMLFLNESQRKSLLAKIDGFTDEQTGEMEKKFFALHEKENELVKRFLKQNPDFAEKIEVVVVSAESSAQYGKTAENAMEKLSKFK